ncbi:hypothetical protein H072_7461 [Dactylellina haptotyla CBS 200.50]|uniref:4Fe-4S ferredoxin-type domain-containing protein n=1 Tax=Dactylellina haptotyla (strain CBS 200.50) TaxID=1284197 RepID=S8A6Y8_DACHA|nr:hypothetical protein H072_7461 [Dactylellina haptotyla CBS 200.50]
MKCTLAYGLVAFLPTVLSHCLITDSYGNANPNIKGYGLGLLENTNRGSDSRVDGQRDCTIFSNPAMTPNGSGAKDPQCKKCPAGFDIQCAKCKGVKGCRLCPLYDTNCPQCRQRDLNGCGRTYYTSGSKYYVIDRPELKGTDPNNPLYNSGYIHTANWIEWMIGEGKVPQVTAGGWLWINMFQQTTDGAGPYTCRLDRTGTGFQWEKLTVPVETVGVQGANPCQNINWVWPLQMPDDLECTGTNGNTKNICIVRCQDDAPNGPFGGCVAFQKVEASARTVMRPPSFAKVQKCKGFQYKRPITDAQIRFLAGDDSIGARAKAAIRAMLP